MTPDAERLAVQREASVSQHIAGPALALIRELEHTSWTFREALARALRRTPTHCCWCNRRTADCPGHPDIAVPGRS